jgi:hypothetical protein
MPIPQQLPYILSLSDLYLTPFYILLLFFIVKKIKHKYYANSHLKVFIIPAFFFHTISSIFFALVYQYYYGYGDTFGYFTGLHEIWSAFSKSPKTAFELIFSSRENYSQLAQAWAPYCSYTGFSPATSAIVRIAGSVGLFCFGNYLPVALIFGFFSFWGTWLIYITITKYFPHLYKFIGIGCLFIPSVVVWSSGISKEPPCIFALGLCFYSLDKIFHKKNIIRHIVYFIVGAVSLLAIKDYIFYTFGFAAFIWAIHFFISHIKNFLARLAIRVIILLSVVGFLIYFTSNPDNTIQQKFIENFTKGENLQEMMTSLNETYGGSGYTLPTLDLSFGGLIQSFFLSLNVTLFRPYIWECNNVLMVISFVESFATLVLVLIVFFKAGIIKIIAYCNKYAILFFMLIFSLLLAAIVGFTSFNFGTLVRYKIPLLPFFIPFLVIVLLDKKHVITNTTGNILPGKKT